MANCICGLLRCVWSFILGSLRMILFFGCLISALLQSIVIAALLYADSHNTPVISLPGSGGGISFGLYLHAFLLLGLALLGCYGSFYKHHRSIKSFALLTALNIGLLFIWILFYVRPTDLERENEQFAERFKSYQVMYDWAANADAANNEANRQWDALQRLFCCGLKGPNDWAKVRPKSLADDIYPASCCLHGVSSLMHSSEGIEMCKKDDQDLFRTGCLKRIEQTEMLSLIFDFTLIGFHSILCLIAYFVGFCSVSHSNSASLAPPGGTVYEPSRNYSPQDYQRFDRSVYIRQPPVNEQHDFSGKMSPPPMYPNAHDIEKASSPPPNYGTHR